MVKADTETTIGKWTLLSDAFTSLAKRWRSPDWVKQRLVEELAKGEVRWRYLYWEEPGQPTEPGDGEPGFWRKAIDINWNESWAKCGDATAYRIEIPKRDLVPLLRMRESSRAPIVTITSPAPAIKQGAGRKKRKEPQGERVEGALKHLYDGKVPSELPTETVRGRVCEWLEPETRRLGLSDPSWDVVNRKLGRGGKVISS